MIRVVLFAISVFAVVTLNAQLPPQTPRAATPKPQSDWVLLHQKAVSAVKEAKPSVIFLGDLITYEWETKGKAIWDERYAPLKAANMGIAGDQTQNVLWRLKNGGFGGVEPKVVILLVGTNNTNDDPPSEVVAGVTAVVREIRHLAPASRLLLLGLFPRQKEPGPRREMISTINRELASLDDGKRTFYLDIGGSFIQPDGMISQEVMPDGLHLTTKGYQIWADAMAGKLAELLKPSEQTKENAYHER